MTNEIVPEPVPNQLLRLYGEIARRAQDKLIGQRKRAKHTSRVRSEVLIRTLSDCGNHHIRTCSPDAARSSRSSIVSSMPIVSQTSLRWNAGSTCRVTEMRRPVLPRPQREAMKRSGFTVREHRTSLPSAKSRPRARTWVEITP